MIADVVFRQLTVHSDKRGHLTEVYRVDWDFHEPLGISIKQVYAVHSPLHLTVRGVKTHYKSWHFFRAVLGSARFILSDQREDSPTYGTNAEYYISTRRDYLLGVPSGVYYGWQSLSYDTKLLVISSECYNPEIPDEHRVDEDAFGIQW